MNTSIPATALHNNINNNNISIITNNDLVMEIVQLKLKEMHMKRKRRLLLEELYVSMHYIIVYYSTVYSSEQITE